MLSAQDANKIIAFLAAAYSCTNSKDAKEEFHRLANELRKASGQPEE
ncbi:N-acetylmuramoyl-L-alanine amidase [Paenibacillus sp. TAB 01]